MGSLINFVSDQFPYWNETILQLAWLQVDELACLEAGRAQQANAFPVHYNFSLMVNHLCRWWLATTHFYYIELYLFFARMKLFKGKPIKKREGKSKISCCGPGHWKGSTVRTVSKQAWSGHSCIWWASCPLVNWRWGHKLVYFAIGKTFDFSISTSHVEILLSLAQAATAMWAYNFSRGKP